MSMTRNVYLEDLRGRHPNYVKGLKQKSEAIPLLKRYTSTQLLGGTLWETMDCLI